MFKSIVEALLRSLIYRFPPISMVPSRLYVWLDVLSRTKDLEGEVVEVGCYLGGTAAISVQMLDAIGSKRAYTVIDRFGAFEDAGSASRGGRQASRRPAADRAPASVGLTRWVLDRHGGERAKIIEGDINRLDDGRLPQSISACLLDMDLAEAIYQGLKRIYPKMVAGGVIAVEDHAGDEDGQEAQRGYEQFAREYGIETHYKYGMGLITKGAMVAA